jgi:phosphoglycerol transferase
MVAVGAVLQLWRADLTIPLGSGGDATFQQMLVRAIVRNGWYSPNPLLGMPDGANLLDFPMPENLHFLLIRLIALFVRDGARDDVVVYNLFYLLTFPLAAVSATAVCRRFGLSFVVSGLVGLLFALLPYHFFRGQGHLILSAYFLVPPAVLVSWWLTRKDAVFFPQADLSGVGRPVRFAWRSPRAFAACLICLLVSATGVYYALFSAFLLAVAGALAAWERRRVYPSVAAAVLLGILTIGLLANLSPSLVHMAEHGHDVEAAVRLPSEAEIFGLKVVQLILPVPHHRLRALARLMDAYAKDPLVNENSAAALGLVGAIGFLLLLAGLFRPRTSDASDALPEVLSRLNLAMVLLGTIGGVGSLLAILISPMIRGYNRVSVFIAFFSLVRVGILLDQIRERPCPGLGGRLTKRWVVGGLLVLVGVLAILDQTTEAFVPAYAGSRAEYRQDEKFFHGVEQALPPSSMIFQLPYLPFPEGWNAGMSSYALLTPYLHSRTLRWSFGAIRGRATDRWQKDIALLSVGEMVQSLAAAGFSAIYIDRSGYPDRAEILEDNLTEMLQRRPLSSPDQGIAVFSLVEWAKRYRESFTAKEWADKREAVLHPVVLSLWPRGFSEAESWGGKIWRWSSGDGVLSLVNLSDRPTTVRIDMLISTAQLEPSRFTVTIGHEVETFEVGPKARLYAKEMTLLPGATELGLSSDAKPVAVSGDPRTLVFRIDGFQKRVP